MGKVVTKVEKRNGQIRLTAGTDLDGVVDAKTAAEVFRRLAETPKPADTAK